MNSSRQGSDQKKNAPEIYLDLAKALCGRIISFPSGDRGTIGATYKNGIEVYRRGIPEFISINSLLDRVVIVGIKNALPKYANEIIWSGIAYSENF